MIQFASKQGYHQRKHWPNDRQLMINDYHLINFNRAGGLVPAIAQDADTGQVLMMAWMNQEAFEETLRTRRACYFSRSRRRLWRKGEESGNVQEVREILVDCDADTILLKVTQVGGAACHKGYASCFFRKVEGDEFTVVGARIFDPKDVYKQQ
jgi:phosphoribosyl-AMP cyclohydrolase